MALKSRSKETFDAFVTNANVGGLRPSDSERWNEFVIAMKLDGGQVSDVPRDRLVAAGFEDDEIGRLLAWVGRGHQLLEMWEADRTGPDLGTPGR